MKKNTHPTYQKVLFVDSASGDKFVCGSTLKPNATAVHENVEYPVYYLSISSKSHPFFTGSKQLVDSEGRVEKFKKRFGKSAITKNALPEGTESADQPAQEDAAPKAKKAAPSKSAKTAKK